jgi:hypothetical protein
MPASQGNYKGPSGPLPPFDGYIRVSQVKGRSGASYRSPGDQRVIIEGLARMNGVTLDEVIVEEDVSGGKETDMREIGRLVQKVTDGKSGGIIVYNVKRYSRDYTDGMQTFFKLFEAKGRLIAEDFSQVGQGARTMLSMRLEDAERERTEKTETWSRAVQGSIDRGIHPGSVPPLGYDWLKTVIDLGDGRTKIKKLGPLQPTDAAPRVLAAFEAFVEPGATWRKIMDILGVTSQGHARNLLENRCYLGIAHARGYRDNLTAHDPIVPADLFNRVQDKLANRSPNRSAAKKYTAKALTRVLVCRVCGKHMTPDSGRYRCKYLFCEGGGNGIHEAKVLPYLLGIALDWHREQADSEHVRRAFAESSIPVLNEAIADAEAERTEIEASTKLSALRKGEALTEIDEKILALQREKAEAEFAHGYAGSSPEALAARIKGNVIETNSFLREIGIRAVVTPAGHNSHIAVEDRVEVFGPLSSDDQAALAELGTRVAANLRVREMAEVTQ